MTNLTKLGIAAALGVLAAFLNYYYLSAQVEPEYYTTLKASLKRGERFPTTDDGYDRMALPPKVAAESAQPLIGITRDARGPLYGSLSNRDFAAGDPIFYRDIETVSRFETLGPFTLLSVGERLTGAVETLERGSGTGAVITILPEFADAIVDAAARPGAAGEQSATPDRSRRTRPRGPAESAADASAAPRPYDDKTRRLLRIIDAAAQRNTSSPLRIVAIIAHPNSPRGADDVATAADGQPLIGQADQALFVPMQNVANVPAVLEIGTKISFVIPAFP